MMSRIGLSLVLLFCLDAADARGQAPGDIVESEPNDELALADSVELGDAVFGRSDEAFDVDHFTFELTRGTPIDLDIDAQVDGSAIDPMLSLFDSAGVRLAFSDDFDERDSRIRFTAPYTGRYYAMVEDWDQRGGADYFYRLKTGERPTGPGDPVTAWSGVPDGIGWIAGGPGGAWAGGSSSAYRVSADGTFVPATLPDTPAQGVIRDGVVDGFGDLLLVRSDGILRVGAGGAADPLVAGYGDFEAVVGPDGHVWWTNHSTINRTDPFGYATETVDEGPGTLVTALAFAPDGILHVLTTNYLLRRDPTIGWTMVYETEDPWTLADVVFDERGYAYLLDATHDQVIVLDQGYDVVDAPFATAFLESAADLAWFVDDSGEPQPRLLFTPTGVFEAGPDVIPAAGARIVPSLVRAEAPPASASMGTPYHHQMTPQLAGSEWSVMLGGLPAGLTLSDAGVLEGVPTESGEFDFVIRVDSGDTWGGVRVRMTIARPAPTASAAADALLYPGALDDDVVRFLDLQGNANGAYDVADFHAYVRSSLDLSRERAEAEATP